MQLEGVPMTDVSGAWVGTYWQMGQPTRFEAAFVQAGSSLSGRVLDDAALGESRVSGQVIGRRITFVKRYMASSPTPIQYEGLISDDSDHMSGQWRILGFDSGPWEAHRSEDYLAQELRQALEKQLVVSVNR